MTNKQSFYLDINIFRPITREFKRWEKFAEFFDREEPGLLDSPIFFTWAQLLESIDLGTIMTQIKKSPIWMKATKKKNLLDCLAPHEALNELFAAAIDTVAALPSLQKDALLKGIDKAVANTCQEAKSLVENTFLRYRLFIASDNYMKELSRELAWAFITSYSFVMSIHQWDKRKKCYDGLMALWHKLHFEGHDLVFFRMAEMQYFSYLQHAPELDLNEALILYPQAKNRKELVNEIFKFPPLKTAKPILKLEPKDAVGIANDEVNGL